MIAKTRRKHPNPEPYVTFSREEVASLVENRLLVVSQKPIGLPVCLNYKAGILRGVLELESEGRDLADSMYRVSRIPSSIAYDGDLDIYGTVVLPWTQYKKLWDREVGEMLPPDEKVKEIIGGTVCAEDVRPELVVWHCGDVTGLHLKQEKYQRMNEWGFKTANYMLSVSGLKVRQIKNIQKTMSPYACEYPMDALLFEDNIQVERSPQFIALKWECELPVERRLRLV